MTTIAWDGKCMASDRLASFGNTPMPMKKTFRIKFHGQEAIAGCAGTVDEWMPFVDWLQHPKKSTPEASENREWSIMIAMKSGEVWYAAGKPIFICLGKVRWAIGSGCDYALGAMDFGATAQEAVAIASKRDTGTGLGIDVEGFS